MVRVQTDADGRVTTLDLYHNQLTGVIPAELGQLTSLELIELSDNQLGRDPVASLKRLDNQLTGGIPAADSIPAELGQLASMELLSLYENQLTGPVPPQLGGLTASMSAAPESP